MMKMKTIKALTASIVMWGGVNSAQATISATWSGETWLKSNQPTFGSTGGSVLSNEALAGQADSPTLEIVTTYNGLRDNGAGGYYFYTLFSEPTFTLFAEADSLVEGLQFSFSYGGGSPAVDFSASTVSLKVNGVISSLTPDLNWTPTTGDMVNIDGLAIWTWDLSSLNVDAGDVLELSFDLGDAHHVPVSAMSLQQIPEPTAALLAGLGFVTLLVRKRR